MNAHEMIQKKIAEYGLEKFEPLNWIDKHELTRKFAAEIIEEQANEKITLD